MDPRQSRLQPSLSLSGSLLNFVSAPTFLGVTLDRTLSFAPHVSRLRHSALPRILALKSLSSASFGPSLESLSLLYCSFIRSLFLYCAPSWFPYCSKSVLSVLLRLHNFSCRIITGCLSSSPLPLLHLESKLPPLDISLIHTTLSFYDRSLRISTPLRPLLTSSPLSRLKSKSSLSLFASSHPLISALSPSPRSSLDNICSFPPGSLTLLPPSISPSLSLPLVLSPPSPASRQPSPFWLLFLPRTSPALPTAVS